MSKSEFMKELSRALHSLPTAERDKSLAFYGELIDDGMENGLTEEQAVAALGPVEKIVEQILLEAPLDTVVVSRIREKREKKNSKLPTLLIIICSPVWVPLAIALGAVLLALYAVMWSVVVSLFACTAAVAAAGLCLIPCTLLFASPSPSGIVLAVGCAIALIGLAGIFLALAGWVRRAILFLSRSVLRGIKSKLIGGVKK